MVDFLGEFREVLSRGDDLPTLPHIVFELHATLDRELVRTTEVALVIEKDPALATKLLRVANSAAFSRGTEIDTVSRAVTMLGLNQVRALTLALAVVNVLSKQRGGLDLRSFWEHSAAVGFVARSLTAHLNPGEGMPGQMYLGGLLHDVGLLLLDQFFPDWMQQCLNAASRSGRPLATTENAMIGIDHGEIGGFLLGRWGLPPLIAQMVASHNNPVESPPAYRNACWTIYAAELVCSGHGSALSIEGVDNSRSKRTVDALRLHGYDIDKIIDELTGRAGELAGTFY